MVFSVDVKVKVQGHLNVKVTGCFVVAQHQIGMVIVILFMPIHNSQLLYKDMAVNGDLDDL